MTAAHDQVHQAPPHPSTSQASIETVAARHEAPRPPITPAIIHRLHASAVDRLAKGEGVTALHALGIHDRAALDGLGIGYFPPKFRSALDDEARAALGGISLGGYLLIPAYADDATTVVDLVMLKPGRGGHAPQSLFEQPRGMVGARIARAFERIVVADAPRRLLGLLADGHRGVVMLRDGEDAERHAAWMAAQGVQAAEVRCWRHAADIGRALNAAGILTRIVRDAGGERGEAEANGATPTAALEVVRQTTPPAASAIAAPSAPDPEVAVLLDYDRARRLATIRVDECLYAVEVPHTMRYADANRVTVDVADHHVPVYYVNGNGSALKPGIIDLRPGKPLPASARP